MRFSNTVSAVVLASATLSGCKPDHPAAIDANALANSFGMISGPSESRNGQTYTMDSKEITLAHGYVHFGDRPIGVRDLGGNTHVYRELTLSPTSTKQDGAKMLLSVTEYPVSRISVGQPYPEVPLDKPLEPIASPNERVVIEGHLMKTGDYVIISGFQLHQENGSKIL